MSAHQCISSPLPGERGKGVLQGWKRPGIKDVATWQSGYSWARVEELCAFAAQLKKE